jgi:hypothetical protein
MHKTIKMMTGAFEFICGASSVALLAGASPLSRPRDGCPLARDVLSANARRRASRFAAS